jgi:Putative restriction endonuclease
MDPKSPFSGVLLAPPASGAAVAMRLPAAEPPSLDDRLVQPETRDEVVRGRRVEAMPALPPHADQHFNLDYLLGAHVKNGYVGSTDLLTRPAESSDFATDTCIRRQGVDPVTRTRYLEELAFEVVNEQSLHDVNDKAEDLVARGVRRVVAIFVKKGEVCEWSARSGAWIKLDPDGTLSDPTLARPLRVRELLDAAEADNAVARALIAKGNPVIVQEKERSRQQGLKEGRTEGLKEGRTEGLKEGRTEGLKEGRTEGLKEGQRHAIETICELLGIELTAERRSGLAELDVPGLAALLARLRADRRWP